VEHGLNFFKNREDTFKLERDSENRKPSSRVHGVGFTENPWGRKAWEFVKTTLQLTDRHWEQIVDHAASFMTTNIVNSDNENNENNNIDTDMGPNPHAVIDLDWYVQFDLPPHKAYPYFRLLESFLCTLASVSFADALQVHITFGRG
jgi:hypothetical protein